MVGRTTEARRGRAPRGTTTSGRLLARLRAGERGDVPGWVLITAMTAGLVIAIWSLAGSTLSQVFSRAVNAVMTGP
ncbi:hypothetical protein ACFOYW_16490 [Gryllotalpicola reticulitermitis]|uniref:DUF4244 domain-containing protein n=1 Tax=Gryllotalpicola reticulitermitis TaxID=1184153 RepID=A0ABV8QAV3_9MICO